MKTDKTLQNVRTQAAMALAPGGAALRAPTMPERDSGAAAPAIPEDSAQFRENILHRREAPYPLPPLPWRHGGLNE
jgi:hypothetical protein